MFFIYMSGLEPPRMPNFTSLDVTVAAAQSTVRNESSAVGRSFSTGPILYLTSICVHILVFKRSTTVGDSRVVNFLIDCDTPFTKLTCCNLQYRLDSPQEKKNCNTMDCVRLQEGGQHQASSQSK